MKKLSSYIVTLFLALTTVPIALFGGAYLIYSALNQQEEQSTQYQQVIAQQLLDSRVALAQFDLLQAELVTTEIAQLEYVVSVKLDSIEYGLTLAEVVNAQINQKKTISRSYPIHNHKGELIGQLSVNKDEMAFFWDIAKSTAPKILNLLLLLVVVSIAFTHLILATLKRPFSDLQVVAFKIANGDYHTPSKTDSNFFEVATIFSALDTMRRQLKSTISSLKDSEEKHARTYNLTQVCLFVIDTKREIIVRANSTFAHTFRPLSSRQRRLALLDFMRLIKTESGRDSFKYSMKIGNQTHYFQVNLSRVINDEIECSALDITELMTAKLATEVLLKTDSLTQVANRHCFNLDVKNIEAKPNPQITVMMMDLNGFKAVNDTYGHVAGDALLIEVARRLKETLKDQAATLYRLGGDEFVILVEQACQPDDVKVLVENIIAAFSRPVVFEQNQFQVSGSIGIAHHCVNHKDITNTIKLADAAMYQAKSAGINVAYAKAH